MPSIDRVHARITARRRSLITDREFAPMIKAALATVDRELLRHRRRRSRVRRRGRADRRRSTTRRSSREANADHAWNAPPDEWDAIALNYTSGTTGNPKGVVYHHRGAYTERASRNMLVLGDAASPGVPVDAADVPLQRLVLPVDDGGARRAPTFACARSRRKRSSTRSASTGSRTTAARRSCTRC